jgi:hypothetical protein
VVTRLVVDGMWRSRWAYVSGLMMSFMFWRVFEERSAQTLPINVSAMSMMLALLVGPLCVIPIMGPRALRHLPVTTRDVWRVTWILAAVVTSVVLLASKAITTLLAIAIDGRPALSVETMLLSAVYDFAWIGVLLPLFPWLTLADSGVDYRGGRAKVLAEVGRGVGLIACIGVPFLISDALPRHVGEFTPATTAVLMACLAIAFSTLAWTPKRGVLAGERGRPHQGSTVPGFQGSRVPGFRSKVRLTDSLTGIPTIVAPYLLTMVALPVGAILVMALYGVISASGPWWFVPPMPTVFDPDNTGYRGLTYFVLIPTIVSMQGLWTPWARLLRVLPLSVRQINALLLLTPFAAWTVLWILGWGAFRLAYGTPHTYRIGFALGMAAMAALAHAVLLRFQGSTVPFLIISLIAAVQPQLVRVGLRDDANTQIVFLAISAIGFCAAALLNHHTLTRSTSSSRAYSRPFSPFGAPSTPGIR